MQLTIYLCFAAAVNTENLPSVGQKKIYLILSFCTAAHVRLFSDQGTALLRIMPSI